MKVCIIGAGGAGLTAIKACLEEGLTPVCYDMYNKVGGLWVYKEDNEDGLASVMKSTIINTSKEMSSYSDFPPDRSLPNYMHNTLMLGYVEDYAKAFDLNKYVVFKTQILRAQITEDFAETGQWNIMLLDMVTGKERTELFDALMVCTGHHCFPLKPKFPNQEKFTGQVIHSHGYKKPAGFEDKRIVVIGLGNSGGDAAVELSHVAKQVYLSTRRGTWVIHRVGPRGHPFDACMRKRALEYFLSWVPWNIKCSAFEAYVNSKFDHEVFSLKPKHRIFSQHTVVNDSLPNRILSGTVCIKGNVKEFTEKGVIFENETEETPIDVALFATGYEIKYPFLGDEVMKVENNKVGLFKYVFVPHLEKPTLGFIGLVQTLGSIIPAAEIQSRWFARVIAGKTSLPKPARMIKEVKENDEKMAKRYTDSPKHTIQADWIPYMDEISSCIGAKPSLWKLLFTDFELFRKLSFGPCLTYQYRLQGPHPWPKAREAIMTYEDRVRGTLASRKVEKNPSDDNTLQNTLLYCLLGVFILWMLWKLFL